MAAAVEAILHGHQAAGATIPQAIHREARLAVVAAAAAGIRDVGENNPVFISLFSLALQSETNRIKTLIL